MRVLHVCRQYFPSVGGVERFVADLTGRLIAHGHQVEIATLDRVWRSPQTLPSEETVAGIIVRRLPFVGGALFFVAPAVLGLVRDFDVLHIHNTDFFLDYLVATRRWHQRQIVVSTHGGYFHTPNHAIIKRLYFRLITSRSLRDADVIIPNSLNDERRFGSYNRKTIRIDNAVDYATLAKVSRQPVPGRLITVGRLASNKNLEGLLRVFAQAHSVQPDLRLVIVGDGLARPQLQSLALNLNVSEAIEWLGEVDEPTLRAELARAEFFLSAATYEGFGLALLEAMAVGVIPIVNTIEAFRSIVVEGANGFLLDYSNVAESAERLAKIAIESLETKNCLSAQAQTSASGYSWEKALPKFERIYREVMETTPKIL